MENQSFEDLQKLPTEELANLSYENCQQICLASLKNTLDDHHIFEYILSLANVKHISFEQLQTTVQCVIPKLDSFMSQTLKIIEAKTSPPIKSLEILLSTVNVLLKISNNLKKIITHHSIFEHIDIPLQILSILKNFLVYLVKIQKSFNSNDEIKNLRGQLIMHCTKMGGILNFLLIDGAVSLNSKNSEDFVKVLELLCEIAESNSMLKNVKAEVSTWKTFMRLANIHLSTLQKLHKADDDNIWSWLEVPMKFLNATMYNTSVDCFEVTPEKRAQILNINGFYLSIIISIANNLKNDYFRGHERFLTALINLQCLRCNSTRNIDVLDEIKQRVTEGCMSLLFKIYSHQKFVECFLNLALDDTSKVYAFLEISIEIIKKLATNPNLFVQYVNLFPKIMQLISVNHPILHCEDDIHKKLVVHLSMFIAMSAHCGHFKAVEEELVVSILQDNYWLGTLAIHMWNLLIRSVTPEQHWKYFMYWISIHEEITAPANQAPCVFVDILLKSMYTLLSPEQKLDVLREKPPKNFHRLWTVLRLDAIEDDKHSNRIHALLINETIPLMEDFLKQTSTNKNYDKILIMIRLIATRTIENEIKLTKLIIEFWKMATHINQNTMQKFSSLIDGLVRVTLAAHVYMPCEQIFTILANASAIMMNRSTDSVKLAVIRLANTMSIREMLEQYQKEISNVLSSLWQRLLTDNNDLIKVLSFQAFTSLPRNKQVEIISSNLFKSDPSLKDECQKYSSNKIGRDVTSKQGTNYLEHQKQVLIQSSVPTNNALKPTLSKDDFDDILLAASQFAEDDMAMVPMSTQKRPADDNALPKVLSPKRTRRTNDIDPGEVIENILAQTKLLYTEQNNVTFTETDLNRISEIVNILKEIN